MWEHQRIIKHQHLHSGKFKEKSYTLACQEIPDTPDATDIDVQDTPDATDINIQEIVKDFVKVNYGPHRELAVVEVVEVAVVQVIMVEVALVEVVVEVQPVSGCTKRCSKH